MTVLAPGFLCAAVFSLVTWALHTFVAGPIVAGPLLRSDLRAVPKFTNYYCWHIVTILLVAMAGGFCFAAFDPRGFPLAVFLTILSVAFAFWSGALVVWSKRRIFELPQWGLFIVISLPSLWEILR